MSQNPRSQPQPEPRDPGQGTPVPFSAPVPGRPSRRSAIAAAAAAAAIVVVAATLVAASSAASHGVSTTRAIFVSTGAVGTVDLRGAPGQVTIIGTSASRVTLTGQLHWTGSAPVATTFLDRATGVLHLSYRCAAASPCTENYRLAVPRHTAVSLRQPSGQVVLSGLAGPLSIAAASVDVSATALRCPSLVAAITSGHLSATFAAPPRRVSITLTSAQATLRLPGSVAYAVSSQVTSGYVSVGIPHASNATRTVAVRIDSGELQLLTS